MERSKRSPQAEISQTLIEFLEVAINFVVYVRGIYPREAFERRRYMNVAVQWARHPQLRDYIHSAVSSLQTFVQKNHQIKRKRMKKKQGKLKDVNGFTFYGIVERVAVIFSDKNQIPLEKFVFKLNVNQSLKSEFRAHDIEYVLRAFLIKLSVSESMLRPLPDDCSWEIVGYFKQLPVDGSDKGKHWLPTDTKHWQEPPLITPIKSMSSEPLGVQLYVEHPLKAHGEH